MSPYRLKGTAGPLVNQSFPLDEGLLLGVGADCDVDLGEADTGRAELVVTDAGRVRLRVLEVGVRINGRAAAVNGEGQELQTGDEIRLGRNAFLLQAPGLRPGRVLAADSQPVAGISRWWLWGALLALGAAAALAWQRGWLVL